MTFHEMTATIDRQVRAVGTEPVAVISALGRIAAREVRAGKAMPPVDVSALDGFAIKGSGDTFIVQGAIDPFSDIPIRLKKGEALFIATGAPFAPATRFIAREHAAETANRIVVQTGADERKVVRKGDWLKKGEKLTGKGEAVDPSTMARLSLAGYEALPVYRKPAVAVVSTGNELKQGRIAASNSFLLAGLIQRDGGELVRREITGDTEEEIGEKIAESDGVDLLIMTGGTAKGKKDVTKRALAAAGARFFLEFPPITPGKTMAFGKKGHTCCFVLPGNPHAIRSVYELFIKRVICRLSGRPMREEKELWLALPETLKKTQSIIMAVPVRLDFAPHVIAETYPEEPNAFVVVEEGAGPLPAGKKVKVLLI